MVTTSRSTSHPWVAAAEPARFGIATYFVPDGGAIRDFVQTTEDLGFDSIWVPDHPQASPSTVWTALTAVAAASRTIRLGPLVACIPYWNPVVLARAAADIDWLSDGRLVLGLGCGDMPPEFAQLGIPWQPVAARQRWLEEALQIIGPLLRGETVTHRGERYQIDGAGLMPPPVQQPYVPILVGGGGERTTLRLVAEYGDASSMGAASWAGGAFTPDDIRRKHAALAERCAEAGRSDGSVLRTGIAAILLGESPVEIEAKKSLVRPEQLAFFERMPIVGTPAGAVPRVRSLIEAGFQYLTFIVLPGDTGTLRLLAERVLPEVIAAARALTPDPVEQLVAAGAAGSWKAGR